MSKKRYTVTISWDPIKVVEFNTQEEAAAYSQGVSDACNHFHNLHTLRLIDGLRDHQKR